MSRYPCVLSICYISTLLLFDNTAFADDQRVPLNDLQLDQITAGAAQDPYEQVAAIEVNRTTRAGTTVTAEGTAGLIDAARRLSIDTLSLTDNAQSNLRSLINVNAVNSEVNILLNLNISVDSNIGSINQSNFNRGLFSRRPGG